jgi:hypothetical protein
MQFRAAKSRCTNLRLVKYAIPVAIWAAIWSTSFSDKGKFLYVSGPSSCQNIIQKTTENKPVHLHCYHTSGLSECKKLFRSPFVISSNTAKAWLPRDTIPNNRTTWLLLKCLQVHCYHPCYDHSLWEDLTSSQTLHTKMTFYLVDLHFCEASTTNHH